MAGLRPSDALPGGSAAMAVVCRRYVLWMLVGLLGGSVAQQQVTPHPEVCAGNPDLCRKMQAACPASYRAGSLITPDPHSQMPKPACSLPPGGAETSAGDGKCHDGWMCDISNVTGSVKKTDFSDACVRCPTGTCCVTMAADNLTRGLEDIIAEINPAAALLPTHEDKPRLAGAVLVYRRPCPRNYQCPEGMIDDARMVGKGADAGEQCVSQKCKVYQGCPEGTDIPDTGDQKIFALVASLVWYVAVIQLRFCHRKTRDKKLKKARSSTNLRLDTSQSYSDLHIHLRASPSGQTDVAENQPPTGLWSQVRTNWQESGLRDTGILMSSIASEATADQASRRPFFLRLNSGPCSKCVIVWDVLRACTMVGVATRRLERFPRPVTRKMVLIRW